MVLIALDPQTYTYSPTCDHLQKPSMKKPIFKPKFGYPHIGGYIHCFNAY